MFRIGQEVVCVNNQVGFVNPIKCPLNKGDIYKIIDIRDHGEDGLRLKVDGDLIHWWSSTRFRPIQRKKTDIAIFTEMLKTKEKVE